jgi:hypothetical protein
LTGYVGVDCEPPDYSRNIRGFLDLEYATAWFINADAEDVDSPACLQRS